MDERIRDRFAQPEPEPRPMGYHVDQTNAATATWIEDYSESVNHAAMPEFCEGAAVGNFHAYQVHIMFTQLCIFGIGIPPRDPHDANTSLLPPPPGLPLLPEYDFRNVQRSSEIDPFVSCQSWHEQECINRTNVKSMCRCRTCAKSQVLPRSELCFFKKVPRMHPIRAGWIEAGDLEQTIGSQTAQWLQTSRSPKRRITNQKLNQTK